MPHTQLERPRSPRSHARGFPTAQEEEEANPHRCKAPESMVEEKEEEEAEKEEEEAGKEEEAELHLVRRTQV